MKYEGVKQNNVNKKILMKVTSRERPEKLLECVKAYIHKANNTEDMVWLFTADADDNLFTDELKNCLSILTKNNLRIIFNYSNSKIHAINRDVDFVKEWDILLNISDDQIPILQGYDDIIRLAMPDDLDASLWFHDGVQKRINTQEIIGYNYYNRDNFIYDPRFKSFFCDNLSTLVAIKRGKMIRSNKCLIEHQHPGWNAKYKTDNLYKRNDLFWKHDEDLYNQVIKSI